MLELLVRFAAVVCLVLLLSGQSSANVWRPVSFPSDPNDPYYASFQTVSSPDVTASKIKTIFLPLSPSYSIVDIVVVMDGSGSISQCQFEKGKKALKHMMSLGSESGIHAKYAAVTFDNSARVNFKFLSFCTAASEIMKIRYPGGMTNTQAGLAEAKRLFDDSSSGRRVIARKAVFLVTDGQSNTEKHLTIPNAQALKINGVQIYVFVVGDYISGIDELVKVASYPPDHFFFRVKSLQGFWNIIKLVIKQVSPGDYAFISSQNDTSC